MNKKIAIVIIIITRPIIMIIKTIRVNSKRITTSRIIVEIIYIYIYI